MLDKIIICRTRLVRVLSRISINRGDRSQAGEMNMKSFLRVALAFCFVANGFLFSAEKPKLVVVISIDQFRADYLPRFERHFGPDGFNLFLKQGAHFMNANYAHSVNKTGPGHAVILSGSYANVNGIVSNDWFDLESR